MNKMLSKSLYASILTVGLLMGLAGICLADEMGGMENNNVSGGKHQATQEMDPNMPGMNSDAHGEREGTSEGVNWYVVGGFLGINFLVITAAGIFRFAKNIPNQQ